MKSHEIDYKIKGHDIQFVEIELDPNETVIAEAGAMLYMKEGIDFTAKMGDGSEPEKGLFGKLLSAASRKITGESIFITHFTHRGVGKSHVAFAAPYPGTILPVDLAAMGGTIIVQRDAFLCAALGTKISMHFNQNLGSGFLGGEGFILQKLQGDGKVFIHAGGTVIEHELNGETLRVDTGCVVGFQEGINFSVQRAGNLKSMVFGGEGLFLATLQGTGKVWLQSMPISKLINQLSPGSSNSRKEDNGGLLKSLLES
ncbi:MAG: TIGR00266 family protein [Bacteroidales bacterium]|nr:TIGR00266 family protein [Bacteroidales bacterium]